VRRPMLVLLSTVLVCIVSSACRAVETENVINLPPTAAQWADLGKLPDWSGVWTPLVRDQEAQVRTNPPPWTPKVSAQIIQMFAEEKAGHPRPLFVECLPEGMPSWMLITHNALEFLFTPGRVTVLGESDGNRLRRIYTDGRPHPNDPDPTFHGHSIGHWEGATLVVDTVGILPQSYLAVSEAVGVPNNGDMHVIERIHLRQPRGAEMRRAIHAPNPQFGCHQHLRPPGCLWSRHPNFVGASLHRNVRQIEDHGP
jgi:hypothetical protein